VDIYAGTVVVPSKFKEQILDPLFKAYGVSAPSGYAITSIKKIVVDAGHGGTDPGAIGRTGLREKTVTLDVALRLAKLLKAQGVEVVLTRSSDRFVSLPSRVKIANSSKADLFLSVHANANRVRSLRGFEIYYISPKANDSRRALNCASNASLDLGNVYYGRPSLNLRATLWDMIQTYNRAESVELSRTICKTVDNNLDARILGIKGAKFYVLDGARMPAVLAEVGFLSNSSEECLLKNSYYRQKIAETLAEGVINYGRNYKVAQN